MQPQTTQNNTTVQQQTATQQFSYKAGLYWRKNLWNGRATVPVILSVDGPTMSMKSREKVEFSAPVSQLRIRFTPFGTMVIRLPDRKFALVGRGATISDSFSSEQKQELGAYSREAATADHAAAVAAAGGILAPLGGRVGAVGEASEMVAAGEISVDIYRSDKRIKKLQATFRQAGIPYKGGGPHEILIMAGAVVLFFVVVYLLISAGHPQ